MSSDRRRSNEEGDIVEMRKAIATGSAKEGPSVSSGKLNLRMFAKRDLTPSVIGMFPDGSAT